MKRMMTALSCFALVALMPSIATAQQIYLGENDSGNACEGENYKKVGYETYEECVAGLGEPGEPERDPRTSGGGGRTGLDSYGCYGSCGYGG